jgi:hypothetical protein
MEEDSLDIFVPSSEEKDKVVFDKYWLSLEMNSFVLEEDADKKKIFIKGVNNGIIYQKELLL